MRQARVRWQEERFPMSYNYILTEKRGRVGLVTLNRPEALNALNNQIVTELMDALEGFDGYKTVGAMVVTGNEKAFDAAFDLNREVV